MREVGLEKGHPSPIVGKCVCNDPTGERMPKMKRTSGVDGLAMSRSSYRRRASGWLIRSGTRKRAGGVAASGKDDFLEETPTPQRTFEFEREIETKLREAAGRWWRRRTMQRKRKLRKPCRPA